LSEKTESFLQQSDVASLPIVLLFRLLAVYHT